MYFIFFQFSSHCFFPQVTTFAFLCTNIRRHRISKTFILLTCQRILSSQVSIKQTCMTTGNPCALDFSEQAYKYTDAEYLLKQRLCLSGKMCSSHACAPFLRDTRCSKFSSVSFLHPTQCLPYSQSLKGRKSKQLLTHGNNKCIRQIAAHHPFSPIDMSIP